MGIVTFPSHQPKWEAPVSSWSSSRSFSTHSTAPTSFSRGGIMDSIEKPVETIKEAADEGSPYQPPRFSVFGKKAKIDAINKRATLIEQQSEETTKFDNGTDTFKGQVSVLPKKKFELHPSTLSAVNNRYSTAAQEEPQHHQDYHQETYRKKKEGSAKKRVKFNPIFLERVCLFHESQSPCELKEAHDNKRLLQPSFRLLCPRWPSFTTSLQLQKNIILDKKLFHVTPDNTAITGKLMIRNVALDKSVMIRYTLDQWHTSNHEVDAQFFGPYPKNVDYDIYEVSIDLFPFGCRTSHDNGTGDHQNDIEILEDKMFIKDHGEVRGKVEFSVRFTAGDSDFWDDNAGQCYQIKVICDPLNDPWKNYYKNNEGDTTATSTISVEQEKANEEIQHLQQQQQTAIEIGLNGRDDEDIETDNESVEDEVEAELIEEGQQKKHSQFETALKEYKRAKPIHLKKPQPWLGTRYDFAHSLCEAKKKKSSCSNNSNGRPHQPKRSPEVTNPPLFNQGYFTLTHTDGTEADADESALVSPPSSPTVEATGGRKRVTRTFTTLKRLTPIKNSDNNHDTRTHISSSRSISHTAQYHSPPPTYYSKQSDSATLAEAEEHTLENTGLRHGSTSPLFSREIYYLSSNGSTQNNSESSLMTTHSTATALPLSPKPSPKLQNSIIQAISQQFDHKEEDGVLQEALLGRESKGALLDINSSHYLNLLDKYCFYTSESSSYDSSSSSVDEYNNAAANPLQILMHEEHQDSS